MTAATVAAQPDPKSNFRIVEEASFQGVCHITSSQLKFNVCKIWQLSYVRTYYRAALCTLSAYAAEQTAKICSETHT